MSLQIHTRNDAILERYDAFVVSTADHAQYLDRSPFGIPTRWVIDPTRMASGTFLDFLQRLDGLTFGPEGMPMDKWVFYDCAELPGFIYGFATEASDLSAHEREVFEVPDDYEGPIPLSMYIAIPMHEEGAWFGHNLASLNHTFPARRLSGLGTMTKSIALKAFQVKTFFGATQWTSKALYIHTKYGPLDLHTTWTPAHSLPATLTYGFQVTDACLRAAAGDPDVEIARPEADLYLDAEDEDTMKALQVRIEAGERFVLCDAPSVEAGRVVHPIKVVTAG